MTNKKTSDEIVKSAAAGEDCGAEPCGPNREPGPGRKRSEAKRAAILAAARAAFLTEGYAGASMNAVADAAGVSKATLYSHFQDKEALFAAMVEERYTAFAEALPVYDGAQDPAAALADFARALIENIRTPEHAALVRLFIGELARFPVLSDIYFQKGKASAYARTEEYIKALAEKGGYDIPDTKLAAGLFLGGVKEALYWPVMFGGKPLGEDDEVIGKLVAAALKAWKEG